MADRYETPAQGEGKDQSPQSAETWLDRIKCYQREFQKWEDQRKNIDKIYSKDGRADQADREYSIFWANLEVLKPATYSRTPVPVVAPRFKDSNRLASAASETLERALIVSFEQDDLNGLMQEVRDDFLMYGRGTGKVRLSTRNGAPSLAYDHIACADFAHDIKPSWRLIEWAGYRAWMTREAGVNRFGEVFREVPLKKKDSNAVTADKDDTAPVWELWDKKTRKVYWVAEDFPLQILDEQDVYHDLSTFFPFPKPAYGTLVPGSLVPVPEIRQYKDQIEEINEYTARIAALSESLRVKGFYPAGAGDISEAIEHAVKSTDNRAVLIPISSFAAMGGQSIDKSVIWWPIEQVVETVKALVELRRVVIDDVYQITGISDIVRGSAETGAKKTATEQQLKSQWGSMRIQERQKEQVRFARDVTRIAGEIIAEEFDPDTVVQMAQLQAPTQEMKKQAQQIAQQAQMLKQPVPDEVTAALEKPSVEEIFELLRNDRARGFLVEIETDSTIQPDEDAEKQRRLEFVTATGMLLKEAVPMVMQAPMLGPAIAAVLKFTAQGFRASRPLEAEIDKLEQMLQGLAKQAMTAPPKQDPEIEKVKQQGEIEKQKLAQDGQAKQAELQLRDKEIMLSDARERDKMAIEAQMRQAEAQQKAQELAITDSREREKMGRDEQLKRDELAQQAKESEEGRQFEADKAGVKRNKDFDQRFQANEQARAQDREQFQQFAAQTGEQFGRVGEEMKKGIQATNENIAKGQQAIGQAIQTLVGEVAKTNQSVAVVAKEVGGVKQGLSALGKKVAEMDEDNNAPIEIERDGEGRPSAIRKGKRRKEFARDGENIVGAR